MPRLAASLLLVPLLTSCGGDRSTSPARAPALVQQFSGNDQEALAGSTLPEPLVVEVLASDGSPVGGVTVSFAVTAGGGTLSASSSVTNVSGEARTNLTLGRTAGMQTVTATVGSLEPVAFSAKALVGPPTQIVLVSDLPASGIVRSTVPVTVEVTDAVGNGVAGVAIAGYPGALSGTFTSTSANTDDAGQASGVWQLDYPVGQETLAFVLPTNTNVQPLTLTMSATAGLPTRISLETGNNQTSDPGATLPTQLTVRVQDEFGNVVPGYAVAYVVASGGGSVSPSNAQTDASGLASTRWTLGPQAGAQRVTATVTTTDWSGSVQFDATALAPSPATLWSLAHRVLDAEYVPSRDVIVTVSASPSRLTIVDPEAKTERSIVLPQVPLSVSVDPGGTHAAVSHDGWLSYVNLSTEQVERVYPVTSVGGDVVLAGNGFAYVLPRTDQWVSIHCIELATGNETLNSGYGPYAGAQIRLHPSGDYLYSATDGLTPTSLYKYDIRGGTAQMMYGAPYWGNPEFLGNVWISGDGARLFARSGSVFRSSTAQSQDMVYAGNLQGLLGVQAVVHPSGGARIYALGTAAPPPNYWAPDPIPAVDVRTYEPQYLGYQGITSLPKFQVPNSGVGRPPTSPRGASCS